MKLHCSTPLTLNLSFSYRKHQTFKLPCSGQTCGFFLIHSNFINRSISACVQFCHYPSDFIIINIISPVKLSGFKQQNFIFPKMQPHISVVICSLFMQDQNILTSAPRSWLAWLFAPSQVEVSCKNIYYTVKFVCYNWWDNYHCKWVFFFPLKNIDSVLTTL